MDTQLTGPPKTLTINRNYCTESHVTSDPASDPSQDSTAALVFSSYSHYNNQSKKLPTVYKAIYVFIPIHCSFRRITIFHFFFFLNTNGLYIYKKNCKQFI